MTPMLGNLAAIVILTLGCSILFFIERIADRRRLNRYLPRPTHQGATYRLTNARRKP